MKKNREDIYKELFKSEICYVGKTISELKADMKAKECRLIRTELNYKDYLNFVATIKRKPCEQDLYFTAEEIHLMNTLHDPNYVPDCAYDEEIITVRVHKDLAIKLKRNPELKIDYVRIERNVAFIFQNDNPDWFTTAYYFLHNENCIEEFILGTFPLVELGKRIGMNNEFLSVSHGTKKWDHFNTCWPVDRHVRDNTYYSWYKNSDTNSKIFIESEILKYYKNDPECEVQLSVIIYNDFDHPLGSYTEFYAMRIPTREERKDQDYWENQYIDIIDNHYKKVDNHYQEESNWLGEAAGDNDSDAMNTAYWNID